MPKSATGLGLTLLAALVLLAGTSNAGADPTTDLGKARVIVCRDNAGRTFTVERRPTPRSNMTYWGLIPDRDGNRHGGIGSWKSWESAAHFITLTRGDQLVRFSWAKGVERSTKSGGWVRVGTIVRVDTSLGSMPTPENVVRMRIDWNRDAGWGVLEREPDHRFWRYTGSGGGSRWKREPAGEPHNVHLRTSILGRSLLIVFNLQTCDARKLMHDHTFKTVAKITHTSPSLEGPMRACGSGAIPAASTFTEVGPDNFLSVLFMSERGEIKILEHMTDGPWGRKYREHFPPKKWMVRGGHIWDPVKYLDFLRWGPHGPLLHNPKDGGVAELRVHAKELWVSFPDDPDPAKRTPKKAYTLKSVSKGLRDAHDRLKGPK